MTESLVDAAERRIQTQFQSIWSLAVYGYYSRAETIAAIQRDLAPAYHGAPLPLGYAGAMAALGTRTIRFRCRVRRVEPISPTDQVKRVDAETSGRRTETFMSAPSPTDVLIIGSGAAGAALAYRLSEGGARVVCLEQGPWVLPAEHPHYSNEWEFELQRRWGRSPGVRQAAADYPIASTRVNPMLYNGVGGSTIHYNAHWPRLKPVDFRKGNRARPGRIGRLADQL